MRFLEFPDWLGQLALAVDASWIGGLLLCLSFIHFFFIFATSTRKDLGRFYRIALSVLLLDVPAATLLLLYVAGLPKA